MTQISPATRTLFLIGSFAFVLMGIVVTSQSVTLPLLSPGHGENQWPGYGFFGGSMLSIFVSAFATKWASQTPFARLCAICYATGAMIIGARQGVHANIAGMALIGIGNGGMSIWYNAEVARRFPDTLKERGLMVLNGCWALGAIIGPSFAKSFDHRISGMFVILGALGVVLMILTQRLPDVESETHHVTGKIVRDLRPLILAPVMGLYVGCESATIQTATKLWTPGLSVAQQVGMVAAVTTGMWLSFAIFRFGAGGLTKWLDPREITTLCTIGISFAFLLTMNEFPPVISFALLGASMGPVFPALVGWVSTLTKDAHWATSWMLVAAGIGGFTVPMMVSSFGGGDSLKSAQFIMGGFVLMTITCIVLWRVLRPIPEPVQ